VERIPLTPRENWQTKVEELGMLYHTIDEEIYWDESACYRFTSAEIDTLDRVAVELNRLCIDAAERIIRDNLFGRLRIPEHIVPLIIHSWEMDDPSIYGRFDLVYDGINPPKLLEYNADTPTAILESSVIQWFWLQDRFPAADQFNSIHEKLTAGWRDWPYLDRGMLHFACASESAEDLGNLEYLRDTAIQGGFTTKQLFIEDIGWDESRRCFVDLEGEPIRALFKLYPWEWLAMEEFGPYLIQAPLRMTEPAWKMVLSNKGLLPVLWEMFPDHPNLLEASFDEHPLAGDYVRKPLLSREGENILIHRNGEWIGSSGTYGDEGHIYQRFVQLPAFDGNFPVIGSWIIGGESAGIGIREDRTMITTNGSRFVPHYFEEV
jgi:glutathionylspermidine synthase